MMGSLTHLNKYFFKYRIRFGLGVLFVIIGTFFSVLSVPYVGKAIDYVKKIMEREPATVTSEDNYQLLMFGLLIVGTTILNGIFMFLKRQTLIVMSRFIENDLKNEIYRHYQLLDMEFYKKNSTGDLMNRISEDVGKVRMYVGPAVMYMIDTVTILVLTIAFMLQQDVKLTIYSLAPFPIMVAAIYYVSDRINKKSTVVQEKLSNLSTLSQESFSGIRVLKAYGMESPNVNQYAAGSEDYKKAQLDLTKTESLFQPFMLLMVGLSTILVVYAGGMQVIAGNATIGTIGSFIIYVTRLTWPVVSLGWVVSLIQRASASQKRINEFLQTRPNVENVNEYPLELKGRIDFKNVSFTYKDSGTTALRNVSFSIAPGETIAIVGRIGSGKSTIAQLISRLYDVSEGEILLDGKNIRDVNLYELRRQIGYVPQDVFLFSETVTENIAFSATLENVTEKIKQVEQAAKDAAIYASIMEFPEKFDTVVGERGIMLSGGQKQRLSIARAIIGKPGILVFDDCLSAVDTETEEEIITNLKRVMEHKTTVIISHRISSVKHANHILVLEQGAIIEQGNHDELVKKGGFYADLFKKQQQTRHFGN